ncbi:response regulator transcription factor [Amaricoccus sp.]|uniref:response regulator n=1 Tax=Amaricoccus sp. TaxID=1872485 RepID=UPI0026233DA1|nr:response regulator transcription factor [uncultured Amaricoccus sp.]
MRSAVISLTNPRQGAQHVMVVDDHPLFCEALAMTLTSALSVQTITTANCLADGLSKLRAGDTPDAVLLDLNLPDVAGLDGLVRLKAAAPGVPVIVVSSYQDSRIITSVMQAGAAGFIPKHSAREVFVRAFSRIWAGETFTPDSYVAPKTRAESQKLDPAARLGDLTAQQARILDLVCEGKPNKQIAYELSIAETTVKAHITAILRKLGAQSRTQAVLVANKASFASILRQEPKGD